MKFTLFGLFKNPQNKYQVAPAPQDTRPETKVGNFFTDNPNVFYVYVIGNSTSGKTNLPAQLLSHFVKSEDAAFKAAKIAYPNNDFSIFKVIIDPAALQPKEIDSTALKNNENTRSVFVNIDLLKISESVTIFSASDKGIKDGKTIGLQEKFRPEDVFEPSPKNFRR
jgi:hypothetical protein